MRGEGEVRGRDEELHRTPRQSDPLREPPEAASVRIKIEDVPDLMAVMAPHMPLLIDEPDCDFRFFHSFCLLKQLSVLFP